MNRRTFLTNTLTSMLGIGILGNTRFGFAQDVKFNNPLVDSVIYVYLEGGMTHVDTFDPKTSDVAGRTKVLQTKIPGMNFGHNLPNMAKHAEHFGVFNGITSNQGAHEQGQYLMKTSYRDIGTITHPTLGAWASYYDRSNGHSLPSYISIRRPSRHPGQGWMNAKYAPLDITNPERGLQYSTFSEGRDKRLDILNRLNERYDAKSIAAKDYADFYDEAFRLVKSDELDVFDLKKESDVTRDKYGRSQFGQGLLLAKRLVSNGTKFVELTHGGWDTHNNNFDAMDNKLPELDNGITALIEDLKASGQLERTLIVLATEFGRTPNINVNDGRDHYPKAFSSVMIGGPIQGKVWGKTDEFAKEVVENKTSIEDFNATIAYALGIPETEVSAANGRPFQPAHDGKAVKEIFV